MQKVRQSAHLGSVRDIYFEVCNTKKKYIHQLRYSLFRSVAFVYKNLVCARLTSTSEILCKERDRLQGKIVAKEGRKEAKPISMEDFDLLRVIGRGSFGKVHSPE